MPSPYSERCRETYNSPATPTTPEPALVEARQCAEQQWESAQEEVTRLTEALAAMTSESDSLHRMFDAEHAKLNAAEARVRELEAEKTHLLGIEAEPDAAGLYHDRVHRDPPGQRPARTGGPQAVERRDQGISDLGPQVALVAQLEAARTLHEQALNERDAAHTALEAANAARAEWERLRHEAYALYRAESEKREDQVAQLTRERDEARTESKQWQESFMRSDEKRRAHQASVRAHERHGSCVESEVARLTEALAAAEVTIRFADEQRRAAEARVSSLESAAREMVRVVQTEPLDVDDVEAAAEALEAALGGDAKAQRPGAPTA